VYTPSLASYSKNFVKLTDSAVTHLHPRICQYESWCGRDPSSFILIRATCRPCWSEHFKNQPLIKKNILQFSCKQKLNRKSIRKCGPMPNVMAALPNVGGTYYESSVIPFLVPCSKVWLTPIPLPCSYAAKIGERKTWTQSEFCTWQNSVSGQDPRKCIYSVAAQETTKIVQSLMTSVEHYRCSNEAKTRYPLKYAGVPQTHQSSSASSIGQSSPYCEDMWRRYCRLTFFPDCRYVP